MTQDLRGRVIVITGGSSGIGAATGILCGKLGMNVVMGARRVEKLQDVCAKIEAVGGRALAVQCDVNSDADVKGLVDQAVAKFGTIDIAFANAGYGFFNSVMETTDVEARAIFETNVFGTLRLIQGVVPVMRKAGKGHIIICSSAASEISPPLFGHYSATKAAQDSIACSLRAELSVEHIFVTSIHPIGTRTEFFDSAAVKSPKMHQSRNTPDFFQSTSESVAGKIVRAMRRNRPPAEVWPSVAARFCLAFLTAFPWLSAKVIRRMYLRMLKDV